ncbi:tetratricopeptide repeat protein [Maritalea sp.]|jgi:TPR repeat protein|uniref:tetratricopeptide repeat protein n=1 Tax=Maritalea sp. TaxID=2003361 RepID=UPI0039E71327
MRTFSTKFVACLVALSLALVGISSANAQDNTNILSFFGDSDSEVSNQDLLAALEEAADAGQPIALWRLGMMYEKGDGVQQDRTKAFLYFRELANDNADTPPKSVGADIVAQSFLKIGQYYREGVPDAGVQANDSLSRKLLLHAASYFGDADAQYKVGQLYLDENEFGYSPLQSARWLSLASRKGHPAAQATLGDLMFNGEGIDSDPVEGLMWLTLASRGAGGTDDEHWIAELHERAISVASPDQRQQAVRAADSLGSRFGG